MISFSQSSGSESPNKTTLSNQQHCSNISSSPLPDVYSVSSCSRHCSFDDTIVSSDTDSEILNLDYEVPRGEFPLSDRSVQITRARFPLAELNTWTSYLFRSYLLTERSLGMN
jgi:hypothetical protein